MLMLVSGMTWCRGPNDVTRAFFFSQPFGSACSGLGSFIGLVFFMVARWLLQLLVLHLYTRKFSREKFLFHSQKPQQKIHGVLVMWKSSVSIPNHSLSKRMQDYGLARLIFMSSPDLLYKNHEVADEGWIWRLGRDRLSKQKILNFPWNFGKVILGDPPQITFLLSNSYNWKG